MHLMYDEIEVLLNFSLAESFFILKDSLSIMKERFAKKRARESQSM